MATNSQTVATAENLNKKRMWVFDLLTSRLKTSRQADEANRFSILQAEDAKSTQEKRGKHLLIPSPQFGLLITNQCEL